MSYYVKVPKHIAEKKPPHGQPCNRCGLCCMITLCPMGRQVLRQVEGPCPALTFDKDGSRCGLVDHPNLYAPVVTERHGLEAASAAAAFIIISGVGCDARINGEPINDAFNRKLDARDAANQSKIAQAKFIWGIE